MVVAPVYVFAPESTQVQAPDLVRDVTPVMSTMLSPMMAAIVLASVLEPVRVRVLFAVLLLKPMAPGLVKFTAPVPEASRVLEACRENRRSVLTAAPV
jgi:hypothetical protein